jgi:membrane protein implicated in regulation of membrane protease activity
MARARAFGAFWYDFVVGDDWLLAVAVVAGLAGTWLLSRGHVAAWWLLPVLIAVALAASLWRAVRPRPRR